MKLQLTVSQMIIAEGADISTAHRLAVIEFNPSSHGFGPLTSEVVSQLANVHPGAPVLAELSEDGRILMTTGGRWNDDNSRLSIGILSQCSLGVCSLSLRAQTISADGTALNATLRATVHGTESQLVKAAKGEIRTTSRELTDARRLGRMVAYSRNASAQSIAAAFNQAERDARAKLDAQAKQVQPDQREPFADGA